MTCPSKNISSNDKETVGIVSIVVPVRIQTSPTPQTCNYEVSDARRTLCKYYKVPFIPCDVQFDDKEHIRQQDFPQMANREFQKKRVNI